MKNIGSFPFAAACNNCSHVGGHYQNEKNNRDSGLYKHIKYKTKQKKKCTKIITTENDEIRAQKYEKKWL